LIGVDANVLIRLFTADDLAQHKKSVEFFGARTIEEPAFVSVVTIAETIWVLRSTYKFTYEEVFLAIAGLLDSDDFVLEERSALEHMRIENKPALTADFLVAHLGQRAGCSHTVTFDRRAAKAVPSMQLLA